jgi:hypothetical protein
MQANLNDMSKLAGPIPASSMAMVAARRPAALATEAPRCRGRAQAPP